LEKIYEDVQPFWLEIIGNILADSWYFSRALIQKLLFSLKACFEYKLAWQNDQLIGQ